MAHRRRCQLVHLGQPPPGTMPPPHSHRDRNLVTFGCRQAAKRTVCRSPHRETSDHRGSAPGQCGARSAFGRRSCVRLIVAPQVPVLAWTSWEIHLPSFPPSHRIFLITAGADGKHARHDRIYRACSVHRARQHWCISCPTIKPRPSWRLTGRRDGTAATCSLWNRLWALESTY